MLKMLSHCLFMTHFIELADQAEKAIRDVFPPTPLQRNEHLSAIYDADIWLKREDLSPVRSYKLRGAFNAMRKFSDKKAFVCASAGNHAQGVAFMCRQLKVNGIIFMPVTTPQQKIQKTQNALRHTEVMLTLESKDIVDLYNSNTSELKMSQ